MKLVCDGRRLSGREVRALAAEIGTTDLAAMLRSEGFAMKPVRAPRVRNGDVTLRTVWGRSEANAIYTIRIDVRLVAPRPA